MSHTTAFCFLGILVGVGLCQCQSSSSQLQLEVASADALVTESPSSPSSPDAVVSSVPLHVDAAPAAANLLVASESTLRSVSHAMPFFSSPECSEAFKPGSGGEGFGSLGPMQSSRGKWLVFKPGRDGMWYAHSASGVFPVCSAAPLGTVLGELQRVPVDVQRSRLHIMEASATPLHKPCVYVGRLGLLGGTPTYRPIEWRPGHHIRLSSCDSRTEVYHIPLLPGYRYWGYREDPGSVVQRASCSIRYVAASSKEAINQLSTYDDECALESRLLADVAAGLVNLGAVEGRGGIRQMPKDAGLYASRFSHEALVIYASTGENTLFWQDSRVDVQLEIGMERISPEEEIAQRAVQELLQLQCEDVALRAKLKRNQEKALAARDRARKKPPHPSSVVKGMAFGACEWKKYFKVNVGEETPLPSNLEEILHAKAPFLLEDEQASQRVRENHILTLIPAQVDGEPFTLDKLGSLIQPHFPDNDRQELGCNSHGFLYYSPYLTSDDRTKPLSRSSYWLLLPKTILEGSRNKRYADRKRMVLRYQSAGYRLPHVLEMSTALLSHYV